MKGKIIFRAMIKWCFLSPDCLIKTKLLCLNTSFLSQNNCPSLLDLEKIAWFLLETRIWIMKDIGFLELKEPAKVNKTDLLVFYENSHILIGIPSKSMNLDKSWELKKISNMKRQYYLLDAPRFSFLKTYSSFIKVENLIWKLWWQNLSCDRWCWKSLLLPLLLFDSF